MSAEKIIEKIEKIDGSLAKLEHTPDIERIPANKEQFETLMQKNQGGTASSAGSATAEVKTVPNTQPASIMTVARDLNYSDARTTSSILSQTQEAITTIDKIKKSLNSPDVQVRKSAQQLLNNKLSHIDESLKIALSKAGVEYEVPTDLAISEEKTPHDRPNPIKRFLHLLTDGQWQLERLGGELQAMEANSQQLTPVNMLAIQVKVAQIQQELELFSSLLNKGLESIKTIMNIQV